MPTYEKLTPSRFVQNLSEGKYESATAARRGVGKASWSDKEKDKARGLILGHFGEAAPPANAPKVAKKTQPAGARVGKGGLPRNPVTAAPVEKRAAKEAVPASKLAKKLGRPPAKRPTATPKESSPFSAQHVAPMSPMDVSRTIDFVRVAREELTHLHQLNPALSITAVTQTLQHVLEDAIARVGQSVTPAPAAPAAPIAAAAVTAVPRIHLPSPTKVSAEAAIRHTVPVEPADYVTEYPLTATEQAAKEMFQGSHSTVSSLPRPTA